MEEERKKNSFNQKSQRILSMSNSSPKLDQLRVIRKEIIQKIEENDSFEPTKDTNIQEDEKSWVCFRPNKNHEMDIKFTYKFTGSTGQPASELYEDGHNVKYRYKEIDQVVLDDFLDKAEAILTYKKNMPQGLNLD